MRRKEHKEKRIRSRGFRFMRFKPLLGIIWGVIKNDNTPSYVIKLKFICYL